MNNGGVGKVGGEATGQNTIQPARTSDFRKINDLVKSLGKSSDPEKIEEIADKLMVFAKKGDTQAKEVLDAVGGWLTQQGKIATIPASQYDLAEAKQLSAVLIVRDIALQAKKGSSVRGVAVKALISVEKGNYTLKAGFAAHDALVDLGVAGYEGNAD